MKSCPKCGKQFPDGVKQCPFDRIPLNAAPGAPAPAPAGSTAPAGSSVSKVPGKPSANPAPDQTGGEVSQPAQASSAPPTPPNKRVFAILLDFFIFNLVVTPILFVIPGLQFPVTFVLGPIYILLKDFRQGQSIGKLVTGLQIFGDDGTPPPIQKLILRNVPFAIPIIGILMGLLEYLVSQNSADRKRLGDRFAGTRVGDLHPERGDSMFLLYSIGLIVLNYFIIKALTPTPNF